MAEETLLSRLKHGWNAFMNKDPTPHFQSTGISYSYRPDRARFSRGNERSLVTSIYNRIAMDCAGIEIRHVKLDENDRYLETVKSGLNECLNIEANLDQTGRSFRQDIYMSLLDEGAIAIVPVDRIKRRIHTTFGPIVTGSYDIQSMRVGKILEWYPQQIKVRLYNDKTGKKEDIILPKSMVCIIENPLYAVINEPNSTMQRLVRKLNLLDAIDEQSGSGKLDMIIQLPYTIKSETRRQQVEQRRKDIENQLRDSKYGIAYIDGTEHVTQLNRSLENNLMKQIEYLTSMLYGQLGLNQTVLDGTANEETMLNYYDRTIEPIVSAVVDEMKRKYLTKTARSRFQSIMYFRSQFKLVPTKDLAELADKMTRNEIMTSNEFRQILGMKPSDDPKADQLINSNISQPIDTMAPEGYGDEYMEEPEQSEEPANFANIKVSDLT